MERVSSTDQKSVVGVTTANEVCTYDADVIRTYPDSTGTLSYNSARSIRALSLDAAKIDGRYVQSNETEALTKAPCENVIGGLKPHVKLIDTNEMKKKTRLSETLFDSRQPKPVPFAYGQRETQLTKTLIYETVNQYFENPRNDIDLTLRISRNGLLPRLHVELQPSLESIARADRSRNVPLTSDFGVSPSAYQAASMNSSSDSDVSTARSPRNEYLGSAFSYLRAIVKGFENQRALVIGALLIQNTNIKNQGVSVQEDTVDPLLWGPLLKDKRFREFCQGNVNKLKKPPPRLPSHRPSGTFSRDQDAPLEHFADCHPRKSLFLHS